MSLSLRESNVSKVVKTAIVDMSFMPTAGNGHCVIAACDKQGQVCVTLVRSRVKRCDALYVAGNFALLSNCVNQRNGGCRFHVHV